MTTVPANPCRVVGVRRGAVIVIASLLLSVWAIYADPVIDGHGAGELWAAGDILDGQWRSGLDTAGRPFHALLVAAVSGVTGLPLVYAAYFLNAGFMALLALGFVAVAAMLGGDRRVQGLAALVVLLYPALNAVRPDVSGDTAYWACYVWGLAWFLHYIAARHRPSAVAAALAGVAAVLFSLQALVFVLIVPLWLLARERGITIRVAAIAAAAGVLLVCLLWQQALQSGVPGGALLRAPLEHLEIGWREAGRALQFKLEGLRGGFLDRFSGGYDHAALLTVIVMVSVAGLVKTLGGLYSVLAVAAAVVPGRTAGDSARYWWGVFGVLAGGTLLVAACTGFLVTRRDAMPAALTLLAIVPAGLGYLWRHAPVGGGVRRWGFPVIMALILVAGAAGLDLRTGEHHLREAGLWLRADAKPGDKVYSNSRVVGYYSGTEGDGKASRYTWRHAMNLVHRDPWQEYEYLALVVPGKDRHREAVVKRWLEIEPVKMFANGDGDRVLIFNR